MPEMEAVIDIKPTMQSVVDNKPTMSTVFGETGVYYDPLTLEAGMWMGFGALTYPTTIVDQVVRL